MLLAGVLLQAAHSVGMLTATAFATQLGVPVFRYTVGFREWWLTLIASLAAGLLLTALVVTALAI